LAVYEVGFGRDRDGARVVRIGIIKIAAAVVDERRVGEARVV
jgi:hypothetical protein